jgi:hypothetical protein
MIHFSKGFGLSGQDISLRNFAGLPKPERCSEEPLMNSGGHGPAQPQIRNPKSEIRNKSKWMEMEEVEKRAEVYWFSVKRRFVGKANALVPAVFVLV